MSYILNALRKSEEERQQQNTETLENRIQDKQDSGANPLLIGVVALIIINLCFLLYFSWSFTQEKDHGEKVKTVPSKKQLSIKVKPEKNVISAISDTPEAIQALSIAEQLKNNKVKVRRVQNQQKLAKPKLDITREIKPKQQLQTLTVKKTIAHKVVTAKQKSDFPFLSELDYEFSRKVPNIDINVYVYAKKQQDRFIMVNMKKYQPEQEIAPGITLKEIRINSLVLEYKNKIFQIKRK